MTKINSEIYKKSDKYMPPFLERESSKLTPFQTTYQIQIPAKNCLKHEAPPKKTFKLIWNTNVLVEGLRLI